MTVVQTAPVTQSAFGVRAGFKTVSKILAAKRHKMQVFATTYHELTALSDRDLRDIGISRSDINRLARQAADAAVEGVK